MSKEGQLDTLIHTIYETALGAGAEQLAVYLDAAASHFIVWDKRANVVLAAERVLSRLRVDIL